MLSAQHRPLPGSSCLPLSSPSSSQLQGNRKPSQEEGGWLPEPRPSAVVLSSQSEKPRGCALPASGSSPPIRSGFQHLSPPHQAQASPLVLPGSHSPLRPASPAKSPRKCLHLSHPDNHGTWPHPPCPPTAQAPRGSLHHFSALHVRSPAPKFCHGGPPLPLEKLCLLLASSRQSDAPLYWGSVARWP